MNNDQSDGGVRARFEASFLNYFGRGPNSTAFDQLGQFWLDRLEDGRYEMTRVDDAWTGWLACERANAQLHNFAKLGHEQMFEEAQAANQRAAILLEALRDVTGSLAVAQANSEDRVDWSNDQSLVRALEAIVKATA